MDEGDVLRALPHAVVVLAPDGVITWANAAADALWSGDPLVGRHALDLVVPEQRTRAARVLAADGEQLRLRLAADEERWVSVRVSRDPSGAAVLAVSDVTRQTLARRVVRRSEQRFRGAFDAGAHGKALLSGDGHVLAANEALASLLGADRRDLVGAHVGQLLDVAGPEAQGWVEPGTRPLRLHGEAGDGPHVLVTTVPVEAEDGERLVLVQVQDVTERRRSEQRLRHLALHDQLTDLPARNLLLERLQAALQQRTPQAPLVAALFVDLDEFKVVNDALGHAVGDLVLREVALRLQAGTRPQDTVARLSGDEFVVVCPALAEEGEAVIIAQRLADALRRPITAADDEVLVSASIGIAFAAPDDTSPEALLDDADAAMYRAKQQGRRRFEVFDAALRERAAERARLRDLLVRALPEGRAVVHYQPVVELAGRRVVALEALLRVRDDDGRLLLLQDVLELAAETRVLPALDEHVLRTASAAVAAWSRTCGEPLGLVVNVSAGLVDAALPERVLGALAAGGLPPEQLLLQVTEQTLTDVEDVVAPALARLQDRGVRVGLDGGTGWGPLVPLRRLQLSRVEVDRTFVALLPEDADGLVRAVVVLAAQLGLEVTAEGLETEEQYAALRALQPQGSTVLGQGTLFAGPGPAQDVPGVLDALGVAPGGGRHRPAG